MPADATAGEKRPDTAQVDSFVHWMEGRIDTAAASKVEAGYVPLHRLNRREYTNAIQDLFGLEVRSQRAAAAG